MLIKLPFILTLVFVAGCMSGCSATNSVVKESTSPIEASVDSSVDINPVPPEPLRFTLAAVGDITLGGKRQDLLIKHSFDYPFLATRHLLTSADLAIGNLEMALTENDSEAADKEYAFKNSPALVIPALKNAGLDIVSLANNHTMDFGLSGLQDTMLALDQAQILHHGAGNTLAEARQAKILETNDGQKIAFLAYSNTFPKEFWATDEKGGTAFGHEEHIISDVAHLKSQGIPTVVVSFHWGRELDSELREYQPILAKAAIDAGADLVLGHHPHILQAVEYYNDGLILYSLGNYTFSSFSNRVSSSVVARIQFKEGKVERLEMTPININNFEVQLQPQILTGDGAEKVFAELDALSKVVGTELTFDSNKILFSVP